MLVESTTFHATNKNDDSAIDSKIIDQWQAELNQFIAATAARLDALSIALAEYQLQEQEIAKSAESVAQPIAAIDAVPTEVAMPAEIAAPTEIAEPAEFADPSDFADPNALPSVETLETEAVKDASTTSTPTHDPDEAWARLSAIKSRIAKQLENN